jgi:hypothetical protein
MKNIIRVQLRLNALTDDPTDYTAVVSPQGHIKMEDVVDAIVEEGTEFARESLVDIIGRYNRLCAKYAVSGYDVDTGLVYLRPIVTGIFHDTTYDPAKHSLYVAATQSKDLREEIADTHVEVTGEATPLLQILRVENLVPGAAENTLSIGRNAQITGKYLKIAGDDPSVGIHLSSTTTSYSMKLPADCIVRNDPSTLTILIPPDMIGGTYRLKVVTQYNPHKPLNTPREVTYRNVLTVI